MSSIIFVQSTYKCAITHLLFRKLHMHPKLRPLYNCFFYSVPEPVFSPYLLSSKAAASMKCILAHQPWNERYALSLEENDQNTEYCSVVNEQLELLDRSDWFFSVVVGLSRFRLKMITALWSCSVYETGSRYKVQMWSNALYFGYRNVNRAQLPKICLD